MSTMKMLHAAAEELGFAPRVHGTLDTNLYHEVGVKATLSATPYTVCCYYISVEDFLKACPRFPQSGFKNIAENGEPVISLETDGGWAYPLPTIFGADEYNSNAVAEDERKRGIFRHL